MAYLLVFLTLSLTFLQQVRLSGGPLWDAANAAGLLAFAGMLYLFFERGAGKRARLHRYCAHAVLLLCVLHIVVLLTSHNTAAAYLTWDAPAYMWSGIVATLLLALTVGFALPRLRRRWHEDYRTFTRWHYVWAVSLIALSAYHIIGSGFYFAWPLESVMLLALTGGVVASHRLGMIPAIGMAPQALWLLPILPVLFVALKLVFA